MGDDTVIDAAPGGWGAGHAGSARLGTPQDGPPDRRPSHPSTPVTGTSGAGSLARHGRRLLAMRGWWLGVLLITVLGGALRYSALEVHSFWYDEAVSAALAEAPFVDLATGAARDEGNPPFYWAVLRAATQVLGDSDTALRLPSAVSGTLAIPLMALLGRQLMSPAAGWVSAVLFAVSPFSLELSTEARVYALWHLLIIANMYVFVKWLRTGSRSLLFLYATTLTISVLSHYYSLAIPLAQAVVVFATRRDRLWPWLAATAGAALLALFWLPAFVGQFATDGNLSRQGASWYLQFLATPLVFELGRTLAWREDPVLLLSAASLVALLTFWSPALVGLWRTWQERPASTAVLLTAWLAFPIALPLLVALTLTPLYHVRAASVALPALLLLVAYGLLALAPRLRAGMVVMIAAPTLISTYNFCTQPLKDDWRAATRSLLARAQADEPVLVDPRQNIIPFRHYMPEAPQRHLWYGVSRIERVESRILGVRYEDDSSALQDYMAYLHDANPAQDYTHEIFQHQNVWLVLRPKGRSFKDYETLVEKHGYAVAEAERFTGIDLFRFERIRKDQARN